MHLVWAVTDRDGTRRRHNLGVFLTEADAQEARRLVEPHVAACYVEPLPMVLQSATGQPGRPGGH